MVNTINNEEIQMPNTRLENLFSDNRPVLPEFFVGRESEVHKILTRLASTKNRGGSLISGVYGIGKTSLLNYLKSEVPLRDWPDLANNKARFIFLPGKIVTSFIDQDFWTFVFQDLEVWLEELGTASEQNETTFTALQQRITELMKLIGSDIHRAQYQITEFFNRLGQAGLVCIVLLDNLGALFGRVDPDDPVFFLRLRALLLRPGQQGFSLVAASQKPPDELFLEAKWGGSRFDAGMLHVELSGLEESEVDELIDITSEHLPPEYRFDADETDFIHAIRSKTGGHPGKIQQTAYLLLERKLNSPGAQ